MTIRRRWRPSSSDLATAVAVTFIAATAALSFGGDGTVPASPPDLRGTIAPDAPSTLQPRLPADAKRA